MRRSPLLALVFALAACGDDVIGEVITIHLVGQAPSSIWVRNGTNGTWNIPVALTSGDGDYQFQSIAEGFSISTICADTTAVAIVEDSYVVGDGTDVSVDGCLDGGSNGQEVVHVHGTMVQPGRMSFSSQRQSATGPWVFDADVFTGTYDLLAVTKDRILIRRDVEVLTDAELPLTDVDAEGVPLAPCAVTVNGLDVEDTAQLFSQLVATKSDITLDSSTLSHPGTADLKCVPLDVMVDADYQLAHGNISTVAYSRDAVSILPAPINFLGLPTDVQFDVGHGPSVVWGTLPSESQDVELQVARTLDGVPIRITVRATAGRLSLDGEVSLRLDSDIPGLRAAWLPNGDEHLGAFFTVAANSQTESASTTIFGSLF